MDGCMPRHGDGWRQGPREPASSAGPCFIVLLSAPTTTALSPPETSRLQLAHGTIWDANSGSIPRTRSRAITPYSPPSQEQSDYLGVVRSYLLITLQKTLSLKLVLMIRSVSSFQRNSSLAFQRRTSPGIYTLSESQPL